MNKLAVLLAPMLAASLSGCVSFGAKPPKNLITLNSATSIEAGQTQTSAKSATITIGVPATPQELATLRVPVHEAGSAVAYVKDVQWVEQPARLFARLLADTVTTKTGRVVLSSRQSLLDPGARLTGELRSFGIDADASEAVVVFDASLMRSDEPVFEKRRFVARVPVSEVKPGPVSESLGKAADQVAGEVAEWIGN